MAAPGGGILDAMLTLEGLALELLEYKVEDLRQGRAPRRGAVGAWDLYVKLIEKGPTLTAEDGGRLEKAGEALRRLGVAPPAAQRPAGQPDGASFGELTLGDVPDVPQLGGEALGGSVPVGTTPPAVASVEVETDPAVAEEHLVLQRLARRVWWQDVDGFVYRVAASLRAERERASARLLFATVRNLARYAKATSFPTDVELKSFRVVEPIPTIDDPLLSLNDVDSLAELVRTVIDTVMEIDRREGEYQRLELPDGTALAFLRRLALAVARDPYAGEQTLLKPRGPSSAQLKVALQELAKERLPDDQRRRQREGIEQRLQQVLAHERNLRAMFAQDVARFEGLVEAFFDAVAQYLPRSVGGEASPPRLDGGVLFAENPALRLRQVPPGATALTVHLRGPVRFSLDGVEVAVGGAPPQLSLFVDGEEHLLQPRLSVEVGQRRLVAFHEGAYLHVKLYDEARSLALRAAEALAIYRALASAHRETILAVLKLAANTVVGEAKEVVRRAIARAAEVTSKAPDRRAAIALYLEGSARAVDAGLPPEVVELLADDFHRAVTVGPGDLDRVLAALPGARSAVYPLTGEPLSIDIAGLAITVRQYAGRAPEARESLVAMLPGRSLGSFTDALIEPLPGGTLLCVRGERELAVIFVPEGA